MSEALQPQVRFIDVPPELAGQRLDNFLLARLKGVPKTLVYRIIRKGEVRVNKKRAKAETRLQAGDSVRVPPVRVAEKAGVPKISASLKQHLAHQAILYEDDQLMLLNKPAGLAVHGGSGVHLGLIEALRQARPDLSFVELVHRLDKDTSGCLLVAKNRQALAHLQDQLRARTMRKVYWAWVLGAWPEGVEQVDQPIVRIPTASGERMMGVGPEGKAALTRFRVLKRLGRDLTLVQAEPVTGRTHQIRVHARFLGCPLLGDPKYGEDRINKAYHKAGVGRLFLHAFSLRFQDPQTGRERVIEAPVEPLWEEVQAAHAQVSRSR
ncbi:RluA family pseudouridine synthase [Marinospirillum sp.]|uniref:RluA family pseudouridine synthase n=1 Tax=Marinospirillum sp. TaxID=2183934 RepID=UPI003A89592B